jgi:magnesium transporter
VPIERLLAAASGVVVDTLVSAGIRVESSVDLEIAARDAARSGARSVAVIDESGTFLGVVPPETLLRHLEFEHEEDLARLGGVLSEASAARSASEEAIRRRLWHRLPWLGIGLAGAMVSALIVGGFENELRDEVLLAFFIPAVVYMADAVGTQTETLVIRGMALGVGVKTIALRELATGAVIGVLLGMAFAAFVLLAWSDGRVALAVGISLAISCAIATVVAMALPYLLARFGRDPAFGSGPLATVIQDLLSIVAYFGIALLVVD